MRVYFYTKRERITARKKLQKISFVYSNKKTYNTNKISSPYINPHKEYINNNNANFLRRALPSTLQLRSDLIIHTAAIKRVILARVILDSIFRSAISPCAGTVI